MATRRGQVLLALAAALLAAPALATAASAAEDGSGSIPAYCRDAKPADLPLPSAFDPAAYEKELYRFLSERTYARLGWCVDKAMKGNLVRDTGPYINNVYFGTHPAVRVYYSPAFMDWLTGDRRSPPKDGAIVVKEMFPPPAARYEGVDDAALSERLEAWTVMVRDASASKDGWYWSNPGKAAAPADSDAYPYPYPESGFGQYCIRCHASTRDYSTFATTRNVKGFPGDPIRYRVDDSWREVSAAEKPWQPHGELARRPLIHQHTPNKSALLAAARPRSAAPGEPDPAFVALFGAAGLPAAGPVQPLPGETADRVVPPAEGKPGFLTSDQCMGCHGGINGNKGTAAGPVMFLQTGPAYGQGYNVSPYGEWRWSPMGLAGRDPIFHAQLDSEITLLRKEFGSTPEKAERLVRHLENLCLSCHAVMGQRQLEKDAGARGLDPLFRREYLYLGPEDRSSPYHKYGALGRDGISCSVCHRIRPPEPTAELSALKNYLTNATTGRFRTGKGDEIFGPFKDDEIVKLPMENATGLTPKHDPYIKSSRLCGSCHTVNLPNVDQPIGAENRTMLDAGEPDPVFQPFRHTIEQATYLEWLNSAYQDEFPDANPTPEKAQSCQACHMPAGFKSLDGKLEVAQIKTRIAAIQDESYPEADHMAPVDEIRVRFREQGFRRHTLQGLNALLLLMFAQADDILGVRKTDYMTGADGLSMALDQFTQQARERTADLTVKAAPTGERALTVDVEVVNKAGHRFPSGVGFRRAFLELLVVEKGENGERVVWGSGRTNAVGALVDEKGNILPTEFFERDANGRQRYQPHHQVITRQDQVQIYEELIRNAAGVFTTSFIHRAEHVKDNRLLPLGWSAKGPVPSRYAELKDFIDATHPGHDAARDADYQGGEGKDALTYRIDLPKGVDPGRLEVRASLYYQSIPPSWLRERFTTAPDMEATRRLFHIASRLQLAGTPFEGWKFRLATASAGVAGR